MITAGASRVAPGPLCLHAVATTPAGPMERIRSLLLHRLRPSPDYSWVGSCINSFEACSAFTHVTTCRLAKSPYATLYTGGYDGFVTFTAAPIATGWSDPVPGRAFSPAVVQCLSRRTVNACLRHLSANGDGRSGNSLQLLHLRVLLASFGMEDHRGRHPFSVSNLFF